MAGPGSREFKAGYETNTCEELRVRWRWLVGRWGVGHTRVKGPVATPIFDFESAVEEATG